MKKDKLFLLSNFLFLFFVVLTFFVNKKIFEGFDLYITQRLQQIIPSFLALPFSVFSLVGSLEIAVIILLFLLYKRRNLKTISVLMFFGLFHFVELLGKLFVDHLGPPSIFHKYQFLFSFPSSSVQPGYSYPSGHMGRTIFISIVISFLISKMKTKRSKKLLIYCLIFILNFVMFISRIYLGEHWATDVLGAVLLGGSFGLMSVFLF